MKVSALQLLLAILLLNSSHHALGEQPKCSTSQPLVDLIAHHNSARTKGTKCGGKWQESVAPLALSCELAEAAKVHADDMSDNKFLRHTGSNGKTFSQRISQAGFSWTAVAENIGWGYKTSQQASEAWLVSRDHCLNIMNGDYEFVGAARSGNHWAVVFAK